jgi:hypothetical protein
VAIKQNVSAPNSKINVKPKPARIPSQVTDIFLLENSATPTQAVAFRL